MDKKKKIPFNSIDRTGTVIALSYDINGTDFEVVSALSTPESNWFVSKQRGLSVGVSLVKYGRHAWMHASIAHSSRLPTWSEVRELKDRFIGADKKAVMVLPAESDYVNIHPYCLHLWHCPSGDGLPDFHHIINGVKHI